MPIPKQTCHSGPPGLEWVMHRAFMLALLCGLAACASTSTSDTGPKPLPPQPIPQQSVLGTSPDVRLNPANRP